MPMSPTLNPSTFPVGNGNNNFSNVGGAVAGQPVVMTLYDLAPWNILRTVFQRHGSQPSFRMIVKAMGGPFTRGVGAPTTGHYEQDWNHSLVSVGSIVTASAGAGNSMIIALAAGDMYDPSVQVGGVARQASYPQPNQTLQLPDGNMAIITAKNVTTNPHRLTLKPVNSAVDLDLSVTAGSKYFISSNAWSEASALPYGHLSRIYKYTNTFQIVKAAFASSGSALTLDLFPQVLDNDGNLWLSLKMDAVEDFERACSGALLWGQQINNLINTDNALGYDVSVTGTEGMIPFILANGYIDTYTPGSYTLDELYQVARYFVQERSGTTNIMSWDGYDLYVEREQALSQFFNMTLAPQMISSFADMGNLDQGWQPANDADFVAWLGFKAVHVAGHNFYFRLLQEFNEAIGAGYSGYDYSRWGIYMPLGITNDKNSGEPRSYFGYEWREKGNYKRENVVANIAGVGVAGTNGFFKTDMAASEYDYAKCGMVSEIAAHMAGGNRFVIQKPA